VQVADVFRIVDGKFAKHWDVFPAERMVAQLTDKAAPKIPAVCG
jgi:predicted SnoaL-like aldol condensation-catalyzing enzyme